MNSDKSTKKAIPNDAKKVFRQKGTCSRTFFYLLNREFGHLKEIEERASDPLAGGIIKMGHQCGMLWGASLAVGAEAYRRFGSTDKAIGMAILGTRQLVQSFKERTKTVNCRTVTNCDFSSTLSFAKYLLTGKYKQCFTLAEEWAPEAIEAATLALENEKIELPAKCLSCAAEVARKMGATDEEVVMVAGFAGGLGLNGDACGALAAAIWMNSIAWCREKDKKSAFNNPYATRSLEKFKTLKGSEIICETISGKRFNSIADHNAFIETGGCAELINTLANS